ncbi:MAG: hypothetical protein NWF07_13400 [Candidatus Bathyarchaeota archaeon]|nr:hypothetical protein [Candidatus Bathyarchaeota archaeon]
MKDHHDIWVHPLAGVYGNKRTERRLTGAPKKEKPTVTFGKKYLKPNAINYEAGLAKWLGLLRGYDPYYNTTGSSNSSGVNVLPVARDFKTELSHAAERKFIDELGNVRVNLYDLWRTRKESARMIGNRMFQIGHAALALKKGNWRRACTILGIKKKRPKQSEFPGQWLEYSYGWAPLVGDCYTIANDMLLVPTELVRSKVSERREVNTSTPWNGFAHSEGVAYMRGVATAVAVVTIDEPERYAMQQYGILNPFAVLWEAVPFSFVVDWFVPIGDYINQFNATAGLKLFDYNVTSTVVTSEIGSVYGDSWVFVPSGQSSPYIFRNVTKSRVVKPVPDFYFPKITNPMDFHPNRIANALALLSVVFLQRS